MNRVRLFVGQRFHRKRRGANVLRFDEPIDAHFAGRRNDDGARRGVRSDSRSVQRGAVGVFDERKSRRIGVFRVEFERDLNRFFGIEVVVNDRRKNRFVVLRQEARFLHADDNVFARNKFRRSAADAQSGADRPSGDLPSR